MIIAGILLLIAGAIVTAVARDRTVHFIGIGAAVLGAVLILLDVLDVGSADATVRAVLRL